MRPICFALCVAVALLTMPTAAASRTTLSFSDEGPTMVVGKNAPSLRYQLISCIYTNERSRGFEFIFWLVPGITPQNAMDAMFSSAKYTICSRIEVVGKATNIVETGMGEEGFFSTVLFVPDEVFHLSVYDPNGNTISKRFFMAITIYTVYRLVREE